MAAALVENLTARGHKIAAIKHCPHGHEPARSDSDSDRLYGAGAVVAIASSPDRRTMVERVNQDSSLASLAALVRTQAKAQPDLIIAEGFKTSPVPKILVIDDGEMTESVTNIIATVGGDGTDQRVLNYSFNDLDNSAEWLSKVLLKSRQLP